MATMLGNKLYELRLNKEKADKDREVEAYKAATQRGGLGTQLAGSLGSAIIKYAARRQDKSWHTRTLSGFAGAPTFANPPTGEYEVTDYDGTRVWYPHVAYGVGYTLNLGSAAFDTNHGSISTSSGPRDFNEQNAVSLGIAELYDKIRDKIGYSNNYDTVYLGQQLWVIRNFIVVIGELKKLYRAATTIDDANPMIARAILADYFNEWGLPFVSWEAMRTYIRNNKSEFVTSLNDLIKRFNSMVSMPMGFALLKRSEFMAENVFADNKFTRTPVLYHFYQREFSKFSYANAMVDNQDFVFTIDIKDYLGNTANALAGTGVTGYASGLYVFPVFGILDQILNDFEDQTFRNLMGDIKSKFSDFWQIPLLDVESKLEWGYSEEVNQMLHNATVHGYKMHDTARALHTGIYGAEGKIYQGYPKQTLYNFTYTIMYNAPLLFGGLSFSTNNRNLDRVTSAILDMQFNEFDVGDVILASSLMNITRGIGVDVMKPDGTTDYTAYGFACVDSRVEVINNITVHSRSSDTYVAASGSVTTDTVKNFSAMPCNWANHSGAPTETIGLLEYNIISIYDHTLAKSLSYKDKTSLLNFFEGNSTDAK